VENGEGVASTTGYLSVAGARPQRFSQITTYTAQLRHVVLVYVTAACLLVNVGVEFNTPPVTIYVISEEVVFIANHLTDN